jgi:hypothetical protein
MKITFENLRKVCRFHHNGRQENWCYAEDHRCYSELCPYATLDAPQDKGSTGLHPPTKQAQNAG